MNRARAAEIGGGGEGGRLEGENKVKLVQKVSVSVSVGSVGLVGFSRNILCFIIKKTNPIEKYILGLVCKKFHHIIHSPSKSLSMKFDYPEKLRALVAKISDIKKMNRARAAEIGGGGGEGGRLEGENKVKLIQKVSVSVSVGSVGLVGFSRNILCFIIGKTNSIERCILGLVCKKFHHIIHSPSKSLSMKSDYPENLRVIAAKKGYLSVLKWMIDDGCSWNNDICYSAAAEGYLEILKWAKKNECPWDGNICYHAARGGHFEILKWIRENGCPWNERTCYVAGERGHLEILKWAKEMVVLGVRICVQRLLQKDILKHYAQY
jgi:hypothetical protein